MNDKDLGRLEACPPSEFSSGSPSEFSGGSPSEFSGGSPNHPYYDKDAAKLVTAGHLPHVSEYRKLYAVTFRLHDSLPQEVVKKYMQECKMTFGEDVPSFKTKRETMLHKKMMNLMDDGYGECLLKDRTVRRIVEESFEYIDKNMAIVHAYVIMPNHIHAVFETLGETNIQQVMHCLKSYTALRINRCQHRQGRVWQQEYYDRIIRNEAHYANAINYIRNNPRHCKDGEYTLRIALGDVLGGQASCLPK